MTELPRRPGLGHHRPDRPQVHRPALPAPHRPGHLPDRPGARPGPQLRL